MKKLIFTFLMLATLGTAQAQSTFATRVVKDSLFIPWEISWAPDNHIWFTQKNGYICRLDPGTGQTDTLWHQANTHILSEGGMLGMAVHPQLLSGQPYVYVAYEYLSGSLYLERIIRLTYDAAANTLGSPLTLLDSIPGANFHNGCRLLLVANQLYISTGDATVGSLAQDLSSINGKILRINLDGSIPADNPVAGSPVYSWGQRNVQGLVYAHNNLYSSMHGNTTDDEINIVVKGGNYGWPNVEGFCNTPSEITFCADSGVIEPLFIWTPTIAPSGIDFYEHPMFPAWNNSLLMATLKDQHLYRLKLNATLDGIDSAVVIPGVNFGRLRDVCISPEGRVYISTSNSNASGTGAFVDKIIELYDPAATAVAGMAVPAFTLAPNPAATVLTLQWAAPRTAAASYRIVDAQGRMVLQGKAPAVAAKELSIAVAGLPAGSYWLIWQEAGKQPAAKGFEKK